MLERFSDVYGYDIVIGNKKGRFIVASDIPKGKPVSYSVDFAVDKPNIKSKEVTITCFVQPDPWGRETKQVALAVAIDLVKYRKLIEQRR